VKVGDLVRIRLGKTARCSTAATRRMIYHGIILDSMERDSGFFEYRVFSNGDIEWFCDLELEVISEDR